MKVKVELEAWELAMVREALEEHRGWIRVSLEQGLTFEKAKEAGATTSLDLSLSNPESPAGKADWPAILRKTLPYVDIFVPSIE